MQLFVLVFAAPLCTNFGSRAAYFDLFISPSAGLRQAYFEELETLGANPCCI